MGAAAGRSGRLSSATQAGGNWREEDDRPLEAKVRPGRHAQPEERVEERRRQDYERRGRPSAPDREAQRAEQNIEGEGRLPDEEPDQRSRPRSEEHTSELQSPMYL